MYICDWSSDVCSSDLAASVADVAADAVVDGEFGLIPMRLSQDILLSVPILMSGSVDSQISFTLG